MYNLKGILNDSDLKFWAKICPTKHVIQEVVQTAEFPKKERTKSQKPFVNSTPISLYYDANIVECDFYWLLDKI